MTEITNNLIADGRPHQNNLETLGAMFISNFKDIEKPFLTGLTFLVLKGQHYGDG